jgi:hypothetical protein
MRPRRVKAGNIATTQGNGNKIPVFENFQHGFRFTVFPRTAQKAEQKNIDEEILSH